MVTAILLEDLHRSGREIVLPNNALVTPAARDWFRDHPVPVTWEETREDAGGTLAVVMDAKLPEMRGLRTMLDREGGVAEVIEPGRGLKGMAVATRRLCRLVSEGQVAKGVVFAVDGAVPVCVANKEWGIRAALGMNVPMVEEALRDLGINVLVIEYPTLTAYLMKQMIWRLKAGARTPKPEVAELIQAIEQGGANANG